MPAWHEVFECGKEVARTLRAKRRPNVRYPSTPAVRGWRLARLGITKDETEYYAGTDYKDVHADHYLVLGTDGVIYDFTVLSIEEGRRKQGGFKVTTDRKASAYPLGPTSVHQVEYRRFRPDEIMRMLNRLNRKTNSDPEPEAPSIKRDETFSPDPPMPIQGQPRTPAATHGHTVPRIWPLEEPEEEKTPLRVTLLLTIGPFVFLALLALVLILAGARPN